MKSIKKYNYIYFSLFLFLLTVCIISSFITFNKYHKISHIENNISSINNKSAIILDDINKFLLKKEIKTEKLIWKLEKNLNSLKVKDLNKKEIIKYIKSDTIDSDKLSRIAGIIITSINSYTNNQNRKIKNIKNILIYLYFLTFISFILSLFFLFKIFSNNQFLYKKIKSSINKLENSIKNEDFKNLNFKTSNCTEEEKINNKLQNIVNKLEEQKSIMDINFYGTLEEFISQLFNIINKKIDIDRIGVAFINKLNDVIAESAETKINKIELDPGYKEKLDNTTLDKIIKSKKPRIINDLEYHYQTVNQSFATEKILNEGIKSNITFPIIFNKETVGFLFISSKNKNHFKQKDIKYGYKILNNLKINLYFHYLSQQILAETSNSFVDLMEKKDNETSLHITRVTNYSYIIAKNLLHLDNVTPKFVREISWFTPLHDIGKIGIPDKILLKPGKLTEEEFEKMKNHVSIGENIMEKVKNNLNNVFEANLIDTAIDIISGHQEKYDGSGYPRGLEGEDIPLAGRIVALADVFDALTSKRPYKEAYSIDKSLKIIQKEVGSHFDPKVYRAFLNNLSDIMDIYNKYKEV